MIAEDGETSERSWDQVLEHAGHVIDFLRAGTRHEIAGDHRQSRLERRDALHGCDHVVGVDDSAHMQIADLNQPATRKRAGQLVNREVSLDDFDPVRLNAPRVEARPTNGQPACGEKTPPRQV